RAHQTLITRTTAVLAVLIVWEVSVRSGAISPLFLSSPTAVGARLFKVFADGSIWPNVWATAQVAIGGGLLAIFFGVPLGIIRGRSRLARDTIEPFVIAVASAPIVA